MARLHCTVCHRQLEVPADQATSIPPWGYKGATCGAVLKLRPLGTPFCEGTLVVEEAYETIVCPNCHQSTSMEGLWCGNPAYGPITCPSCGTDLGRSRR
jgi:hypothetical protein